METPAQSWADQEAQLFINLLATAVDREVGAVTWSSLGAAESLGKQRRELKHFIYKVRSSWVFGARLRGQPQLLRLSCMRTVNSRNGLFSKGQFPPFFSLLLSLSALPGLVPAGSAAALGHSRPGAVPQSHSQLHPRLHHCCGSL